MQPGAKTGSPKTCVQPLNFGAILSHHWDSPVPDKPFHGSFACHSAGMIRAQLFSTIDYAIDDYPKVRQRARPSVRIWSALTNFTDSSFSINRYSVTCIPCGIDFGFKLRKSHSIISGFNGQVDPRFIITLTSNASIRGLKIC